MSSVIRRRAGLLFALSAALGQVFATDRLFSLGSCPDTGACDGHLGQAGLAFFAALLLAGCAVILLGMTTGFLAGFCGSFLGSALGAMIAGANGGGIGAWLVGVTFLLTTLLMGGGALAMSAVQRKIMSRVGAELEEALPPRDDGLRETGAPGRAVVLGLTDTGMSINDHPVVRLRLRVSPDDGSAPFEAELSQRVSRIAVPRAGDLCPIRYDQEDHTRVVTTEQFSAPTASKAEDQFGSP